MDEAADNHNSCSTFLKALADDNRWQLVQSLLDGAKTVTILVEATGLTQYNVSKHLKVLRETGILEAQREGKFVHYRIAPSFHSKVDSDNHSLDLGCCSFHFDRDVGKLPGDHL